MVYIPVRITGESENLPLYTFFGGIVGALFFGITIGIFMSLRVSLPQTENTARAEIGGVGSALEVYTPPRMPNTDEPSSDETALGSVLGAEDVSLSNVGATEFDAPTREEALGSIQATITVRSELIDRLVREMELVKNDSIALIAEFDRNCGNWKDTCAEPYSRALEKNNFSYENLSTRLAVLSSELLTAEQAEAILLSE